MFLFRQRTWAWKNWRCSVSRGWTQESWARECDTWTRYRTASQQWCCQWTSTRPWSQLSFRHAVWKLEFDEGYSRLKSYSSFFYFLPHDAMCKHSVCCHPMSVHLSVTLVYCIQTAEDVKLLSCPSSRMILDFWPQVPILNSQGNPLSGSAKYTRVEKFAIFDWNLSRKRYEIGPWLLWNVNRSHMCLIKWWHFQWPGRNSNPVFKVTEYLQSDILETVRLSDKVTIER